LFGRWNTAAITGRAMLFGELLRHSCHVQIHQRTQPNRLIGPVYRSQCIARVSVRCRNSRLRISTRRSHRQLWRADN
jgi:hypothetical protein